MIDKDNNQVVISIQDTEKIVFHLDDMINSLQKPEIKDQDTSKIINQVHRENQKIINELTLTRDLLQNGDLLAAIKKLEELESDIGYQGKNDKVVAEIHYLLGLSYWRMYWYWKGELNNAVEHYEKSIQISESWLTCSKLGLTFKEINELDKSIIEYQRAMQLNKLSANPPYMLARIYTLKEDYDKALEMLKQAIELDTGLVRYIYREKDLENLIAKEKFKILIKK